MDEHNPYAAPAAPVAVETAAETRPLFKVSGVGLATFLGTALAGGVLLAMNYRAMGQPHRVWPALLMSMGVTVGVLLLALVLPEEVPGIVFSLPPLLLMAEIARRRQGAAIDAHIAAGRAMRSNWLAAGISLLVLLALVVVSVLALAIYLQWSGLSWSDL